jgi:AAA domain
VQESPAITASLRRAFSETVDPDSHVPRAAVDARLESLMGWCRADGVGSTVAALVAPPGIGKTHLLRVLESRLVREDAANGTQEPSANAPDRLPRRVLYLPYAGLSMPDLCHWVYGLLGERPRRGPLAPDGDEDALQALCELGRGARQPFHLLLDDADSMPSATLRAFVEGLGKERSPLRLLFALSDDSRATRMLAALDPLRPWELSYRDALDEPETEAYLRARLAQSGLGTELLGGLDRVTVSRICALSGGIPRRIHRVVLALLEPERAALARALTMSARTDAWLGQPMDDPF